MTDDFASVALRLDELARTFDAEAKQIIAKGIEPGAKEDVESAVRGDIGDLSMSGWWKTGRNGGPVLLTARTGVEGESIVTRPGTEGQSWRRGLGPMRVLEDGRKATLIDTSGKKPKMYRMNGARQRRVKRVSTATTGKQTWSDAMQLLMKNTPDRAMTALMTESVRKLFPGR